MSMFDDEYDFNCPDDSEFEEIVGEGYTWAEELKLKLENALEVWIASAYVDTRAVKILKDTLADLPAGQSRELRILLDDDFHENPLAREVIINQLYTIPNVIVKIANTKGKFHPKCFVFNHGSTTGCLVGSGNLTEAAMKRNVEFGIYSDRPGDIKKCRVFFISHWDRADVAEQTDRFDYEPQKFKVGDTVRHIALGEIGCVLKAALSKEPYRYYVFFGGTEQIWCEEKEIESAMTGIIPPPSFTGLDQSLSSDDEYTRFVHTYLKNRYKVPAEAGYYTMQTSRIHEFWYQQIPLIKIITRPRPRLLIADEVG